MRTKETKNKSMRLKWLPDKLILKQPDNPEIELELQTAGNSYLKIKRYLKNRSIVYLVLFGNFNNISVWELKTGKFLFRLKRACKIYDVMDSYIIKNYGNDFEKFRLEISELIEKFGVINAVK